MGASRNDFGIIALDPGGVIGWTRLLINKELFRVRGADWRDYVVNWKTGEIEGEEHDQIRKVLKLIHIARFEPMPYVTPVHVVTEDFHVTQVIGGKELVSPIRINAVLDWELNTRLGLELHYQDRSLRTNVTRERLKMWGFRTRGKDSVASFQHAITYLKRLNEISNRKPWK